jgi:hypothetical protein
VQDNRPESAAPVGEENRLNGVADRGEDAGRGLQGESCLERALASDDRLPGPTSGGLRTHLLVYRCPPLEARITERQCSLNRDRARRAEQRTKRRRAMTSEDECALLWLRPCLSCPGVTHRAREMSEMPLALARRTPEPAGAP